MMAAEYKIGAFEHVVQHFHDGTVTTFRDDVESPENEAYQEWLAAGGVPDSYTSKGTSGIDPALDGVGTGKTINQILGVG
jgi:hypothetical protein